MKRRLRITLAVLASVAVALVVGYYLWAGGASRKLAEQRAKIAEEEAKPAPPSQVLPEDNAYTHLMAVQEKVDATREEFAEFLTQVDYCRRTATADEILPGLSLLEQHPELLEAFYKAADAKACVPEFDSLEVVKGNENHFTIIFELANLAAIQARWHLSQGEIDQALEICSETLKLAQLAQQQPLLLGQKSINNTQSLAIVIANDALRAGKSSPDLRAKLDEQLAAVDSLEPLVAAVRRERDRGMLLYEEIRTGQIDDTRLAMLARNEEIFAPVQSLVVRQCLDLDEAYYLQCMGMITDLLQAPYPKCAQASPVLQSTLGEPSKTHTIAPKIIFSRDIEPVRYTTEFVRAIARCLRVELAAVGQNSVQKDQFPHNFALDEIKLPEEAKTDPFTLDPLKLIAHPNGIVVYSVGRNGQDDSGSIYGTDLDIGLGPVP